ncbi:MAG: hypothetical protein ABS41_03370 [Arenimonas sp. SCN 70-307]|uniref:hypothetical protein n=1 Tax=Arenimonas sp. SCN 70-307 TaxID=1660089 RepID=UPI00086BEA26|nr:hypothetical protein [Arenimonas sp. SCN 70-307]ODS64312.1 MAG: hypothetical protein ABS41_03370 [Arenimonas sp. SCN 70-307]
MNPLEKSSQTLRAQTWYAVLIEEMGLNEDDLAANSSEVSFAGLHRRFVLPQIPDWAREALSSRGARLRTLQNVRDKGFNPTAAAVRVETRLAPRDWPGRARAEREGHSYVQLPVDLIEATRAACPKATAWYHRPVWGLWHTADYQALELHRQMSGILEGLGFMRSIDVHVDYRPTRAWPIPHGLSPDTTRNPSARPVDPLKRLGPEHLDLLAGYVAEATLFGDIVQLKRCAVRLLSFLETAERKAFPGLPAKALRPHIKLWLSACAGFIDAKFGPLALERWSRPILIKDYEALDAKGRIRRDSASSQDGAQLDGSSREPRVAPTSSTEGEEF